MAYINIRYPIYYATLQKDYGLTLSQIQDLDAKNQVYVQELGKVESFLANGETESQIINYFQSQGYSNLQLNSVKDYLSKRTVKDATGKTGREKLNNTLSDIKNISTTALPILGDLAKIFGIGGNSLTPTVPSLAGYKPPTSDGYDTYTIDPSQGKIIAGSSVEVTTPKANVSSLPFGLTTENLILILVLIFIVYLFVGKSNVSQAIIPNK